MQWILQDFEDTKALAEVLRRLGQAYSVHKVVPFVGDLQPEPVIPDPGKVLLFGSYALRHYAARHQLRPGVVTLRPFLHEAAWRPHLLNGPGARTLRIRALPEELAADDTPWFIRPVSDSKEIPGQVMTGAEIAAMARNVLALPVAELIHGSLDHETEMMLCPPQRIHAEWRVWVVGDQVVTASLYKQGARVVYRPEIDPDALAFARDMVAVNARYAPAYVLDICRTAEGLRLLETNCINAAGFYAADLQKLVAALGAVA